MNASRELCVNVPIVTTSNPTSPVTFFNVYTWREIQSENAQITQTPFLHQSNDWSGRVGANRNCECALPGFLFTR